MNRYTEGICENSASILKDGEMMPIEEIVCELNKISNLTMLVRRLLTSMSNHGINPKLREKASKYLVKNNLQGDCMRRSLNRATADQDLIEHEKKHPEDEWRGRDHA